MIVISQIFITTMGLCDSQHPSNRGLATINTPKGSVISAEIANTPAKRSQGLMFRKDMPHDHGMLFVFNKSDHWTFWMKNTKMSLDILWIDSSEKVVHIEPNVSICTRTDEGCPRYHTPKESLYVLELKAGMAQHFEITVGSELKIHLQSSDG
ncbi:MAG: DUF192 domain-containing protein [Nitrospirales bacterium]